MWKTLVEAFKMKDVRSKILWTLLLLLIYRIGCFIPIPGIDPTVFKIENGVNNNSFGEATSFLGLLSSLSGGALSNGAILALGVGPYITSSIVIQLLTIAIPALERLSKQGNEGRQKIAVITRYVALALGLAQAIAIVISLSGTGSLNGNLGFPPFLTAAITVLTLVAGAMFTVFIGDKITEKGVSNGMSMLIFVGILSTGVGAFYQSIVEVFSDASRIVTPIVFIVTLIVIFALIVWVDLAERRIPVTYAKQVKGNKMYGGQTANIPIKVNATGVMPIIFAFSIINFPQLIMSIFWPSSPAYAWFSKYLGTGAWVNIVVTSLLILGFTYFYATLSFNPEDVSRQIQQNGGFILGYRPGKPTTQYLRKVSHRITLFGALFLMFMALVPAVIFKAIPAISSSGLISAFTATGMLIIVSVALEFDKQLQAQMMMKTYKGFLK
ncbi:MAG: preprotein translocase subunit SecY [Christensenellaceae bacterium]|jgi:preprotein translocase subunit SecY|nr:preprotein translocase subunit SecY [Christensenellaceae bacterium]